jgi:hypothetical protein
MVALPYTALDYICVTRELHLNDAVRQYKYDAPPQVIRIGILMGAWDKTNSEKNL